MTPRLGQTMSAALCLVLLAGKASAQHIDAIWVGGGGPWNIATNWSCFGGGSPSCVPHNNGVNDFDVLINNFQVCQLTDTRTVNRIVLTTGTDLVQENGAKLTIMAEPQGGPGSLGTMDLQDATYHLRSTGSLTDFIASGPPGSVLHIRGTPTERGEILLSDSANNRMYGVTGGETMIFGPDLAIAGSGQIGVNQTALDNRDIIYAQGVNPLTIDPGVGGMVNTGLMSARLGGTLILKGGTYTNTLGEIRAEANSLLVIDTSAIINDGLVVALTSGMLEFNACTVNGPTVRIDPAAIGVVTSTSEINHLTNRGTFTINNNTTAYMQGTFDNTSNCILDSSGHLTNLVCRGDLVLTGAGWIHMTDSAFNRIYAENGTQSLTNIDNTIRGSGQLGVNLTTIDNQGSIVADQSTELLVDPGAGGMTNSGIMTAMLGGTLHLAGASYNNTGGIIRAESGSTLQLGTNCSVSGGLVTAESGGLLRLSGCTVLGPTVRIDPGANGEVSSSSYVTNLTNEGTLDVNNVTRLYVGGTLTNTTDMFVNASTSLTELVVRDDTTLIGGGTIHLANTLNARIYCESGTETLINTDNTIRGSGQIGVNLSAIVNDGSIIADQSTLLRIDPNAAGLTNTGLMAARLGGTLELLGATYDNTGGTIRAEAGSTVRFGTNSNVQGGTVVAESAGTFEFASCTVNGPTVHLQPGATGVVTSSSEVTDFINETTVTLNNGTTLYTGGTVTNSASCILASTGSLTNFVFRENTVLTGGGTVNLSDSLLNRLYAESGTETWTNLDNTVRGSGQIGVNLTTIDNRSTIVADQPTLLRLDPGAGGMTNTGLLVARSGATLELDGGSYDNNGGEIRAETGSTVRFDTSSVTTDGLIVAQAGSSFVFFGCTLDSSMVHIDAGATATVASASEVSELTINGAFDLNNGTTLYTKGTFANHSVCSLNSSGGLTNLVFRGDTTMTGGGTIILSDRIQNRMYSENGTQTWINVDNTIRGAGQIGINLTTMINQGSIIADQTAALQLDPHTIGGLDNQGLLRAENGATLAVLAGPFTTSGVVSCEAGSTISRTATDFVQTDGSTLVNGTLQLSTNGVVTLTGGTLGGDGLVEAHVSNSAGTLAPGTSTGSLNIDGAYTQLPGATFEVEIAGTSAGEFDELTATGAATLDGTLRISVINGFVPAGGVTYRVLNAAAISGTFATVETIDLPPDHIVRVSYEADHVEVRLLCGTDWNGDGLTNTADFLSYLNDYNAVRFGGVFTDGDPDIAAPIGILNTADFLAFLNLFNSGCP